MPEMTDRRIELVEVPGPFGVYRLEADAPMPDWAWESPFTTVSRSADELSVLSSWDAQRAGTLPSIGPLICWAVAGPLDFALTGILARLTAPLAAGGVSVFSVATYDTDYLLVGEAQAQAARKLLAESGIVVAARPEVPHG